MNTLISKHILIFCFILLSPALAAGSKASNTTLQRDDLEKVFGQLVTRNELFVSQDVEIKNFSCDPCQLPIPKGTVDYLIISQARINQLGKETITADILVDGITQGRVKMNGDVHLFGEVVCAAETLQRHHILHADDLLTIRRDISMLGPDFISSPKLAIGTELKTTLRPGSIIYKRFLKKPKIVKRGDVVSIMAQTNRLKIRVPGRIESDGSVGDLIRVKNLMSRKEVYARVINSEEVRVDF